MVACYLKPVKAVTPGAAALDVITNKKYTMTTNDQDEKVIEIQKGCLRMFIVIASTILSIALLIWAVIQLVK